MRVAWSSINALKDRGKAADIAQALAGLLRVHFVPLVLTTEFPGLAGLLPYCESNIPIESLIWQLFSETSGSEPRQRYIDCLHPFLACLYLQNCDSALVDFRLAILPQ